MNEFRWKNRQAFSLTEWDACGKIPSNQTSPKIPQKFQFIILIRESLEGTITMEGRKMQNRTTKKALTYLAISLVAIISAFNYELFIFPNKFAPAGLIH